MSTFTMSAYDHCHVGRDGFVYLPNGKRWSIKVTLPVQKIVKKDEPLWKKINNQPIRVKK